MWYSSYDGEERRQRERRPIATYYWNPTQLECFPTALSNLLLEWGEDELAARVYSKFWEHRLAQRYIASLLLLTRYVADVTDGKYVATLETTLSPERIRRILENYPVEKRKAVKREMTRGRFLFVDQLRLDPQSIVVVTRATSHAITYLGGDRFIDDGRKTSYAPDALRAVAVLKIQPVTEEPQVTTAVM